ncbi:MAG: glycosyltransferase [Promethearchaeota archaeon]
MKKSVSLGITTHNEERSIPKLLNSVFKQKIPKGYSLDEIIIVSSGSTDQTNEIIRAFQKNDDRIRLIEEPEKTGKINATNQIIDEFGGDILIHSGGDGIYKRDAFYWLLKSYDDPAVSAVCGHPVPLNPKGSLWGFASFLIWELHHLTLLDYPKKLSGELFSIKREYLERVPPNAGSDDTYLERVVQRKGGKIKYEPRAIIYILGPQTARDFFKQRRRVNGHVQMGELIYKTDCPTTNFKTNLRILIKNLNRFISPYLIPVAVMELFARLFAMLDLRMGRVSSVWESVETTKKF